jgi:hypothetical protein
VARAAAGKPLPLPLPELAVIRVLLDSGIMAGQQQHHEFIYLPATALPC